MARLPESTKIQRRLEAELARLETVRAALAVESNLEDADRSAEDGGDGHPADLGSELFERERAVSILQRVEAELSDVRRARRRLDAGEYGTCEACGAAIPIERLAARPATRFCLNDQDRADRELRAS